MATRGRGLFSLYIYIENLKNLLVRNYWTNCNIISQKCTFGDPLLRLFKPFGFVKKHGRHWAGLIFPIYLYRKLKKSSCQKPLDRLRYNLVEMFLWWSSTKIVQAIWIRQKNGHQGAGLIFTIYIFKENFKNLLVRNHWTDFHIILQKCFFGDPLPRLFEPFGFIKKHGCQEAGLIFPIYLYRKLKKSSCQKLLDQLQYNVAEMFLWWSSTKIVQTIWICQKTWPPWSGAYFPYFKNLLVRNHWTYFIITWQKCFLGDPLTWLFK